MVTPDGFMIPLLSAIGNHDSGTNHAAQVYDAEGSSGPWVGDDDPRLPPMLRLFPHETPPRPPSQRRTYHHHHAANGSISFVVLDSGYVASVDGAQRAWLAEALTARSARSNSSWSFAAYHVPLYASTGVWQSDDDNAGVHQPLSLSFLCVPPREPELLRDFPTHATRRVRRGTGELGASLRRGAARRCL